ncbi:MAG: SRPBCC domain-containing protein [bacterium]
MRVSMLVAAGCLALATCAWSEPKEFTVRAVTIEKDVVVAAAPLPAWNAFTGDVSPWWDHHFMEKPYKLVIDRKPGGGFWELFDKEGHGVKHAEVIVADPGKLLRLRGPLGFSGKAVDLVQSFEFTADPKGTKIHFTLNALGQLDDEGIAALDRVWDHFLQRYQEYVAAGKHGR